MDPLEREALEQAQRTAASERARQTLDAMNAGFRLKRAALRTRHPDESEAEIDARLQRWLDGDDGA